MAYQKLYYNRQIETTLPPGFVSMMKGENVFIRKQSSRIERIDYSERTHLPFCAYLEGIVVSIRFPEVEDILTSIYEKNKVRYSEDSATIHKSLVNIEGVDYSVFDTEINGESSFEKVAVEIKKMIEKGALPFFEEYQTLRNIYEHAIQLGEDDYSSFLSGHGPFKLMILKRLLLQPDYEAYSNEMIKVWTKNAKDYPQHFNDYDKVVIELKKTLDKM